MSKRTDAPVIRGLKGRCPECGEGRLFAGVLKYASHCEACDTSFACEDAGDGPAVFVMFITGFLLVPLALGIQLATNAPVWVILIIFGVLIILASIWLLRLLRGVLFNLQYKHKALEMRSDDMDS